VSLYSARLGVRLGLRESVGAERDVYLLIVLSCASNVFFYTARRRMFGFCVSVCVCVRENCILLMILARRRVYML
jgi:hypothetical protein